jgi:hypothetical protein
MQEAIRRHFQFRHDVLPVTAESINPAEKHNERKHAHKSISHRQSVGNVRHEEGIENAPPAGVSGSITSATAKLVRLRNVVGGADQTRCDAGGQNRGAQRPEHQPGVFGSHPHVGNDHESRLKLFRVRFSDDSAMLIDATDKEHAAATGQVWSHYWDRLDSRRVVTVTNL